MQLVDGSWWASYRGEEVDNRQRRETNFVAYVATGVWHHYLVSGDRDFLRAMWPMVDKAIGFRAVAADRSTEKLTGRSMPRACQGRCAGDRLQLHLQEPGVRAQYRGDPGESSVPTGCRPGPAWDGPAHKPERFDRTWESKARYSMDWFYPVLAGVLPAEARARLAARWDEFVERQAGLSLCGRPALGHRGGIL